MQKWLSEAGLCSRREGERWILEGRVAVNGVTVERLGTRVLDNDRVAVDGQTVSRERGSRLVLAFHKPRGVVCTRHDPEGRPTLFEQLDPGLPRLNSVGRLDFNSEGLILLTNDGELAHRLAHPSREAERTYRVRVHGSVDQRMVEKMSKGVTLDDGPTSVDFAKCIRDNARIDMETELGDRTFHFVIVGVAELGLAHLYGSDITTLRRAEALSRAIFESAVEGILVTDEKGEIQVFNPAAERIFGRNEADVAGSNVSTLMPLPFASMHQRFIASYLQTGLSEIISKGREVEGVRSDGEHIPLSVSVSGFYLGGRHMFAALVSDITARKQAEMELRLAKEAAEKANKAKSEFLSSMSHELRTPLNAVLGFAQLLDSDPLEPLSDSQKDSIQEITKAGRHLLGLINEVLDLAKIEAGRIQISMSDVALRDVIGDCVTLVSSMARRRQVEIEESPGDCPCGDLMVQADQTRLKQVLLNLLSNAVKYNREGGQVAICCHPVEPGKVRIAVTDTGVGIPPEKMGQVFESFNRLGAEHTGEEGTGIGLVIAKRLVEHMGGTIGVESKEGEGSTFWIQLTAIDPMQPREAVEEKNHPHPSADLGSLAVREHRVLLYVEDTPANIKLVERILARWPRLEVISATDPVRGLELARERLPDAILMDINLPGFNGYELLHHLRREERTRNIPVVAVSANALPDDIRQGLTAGFRHYLTKPIQVDSLLAALGEVLVLDLQTWPMLNHGEP